MQQTTARFEALWRLHHDAIESYARRLAESEEDAEDIEGEALMDMWRNFGDYDPERDFKTWASGYIRTSAKRIARSNRKHRALSLESLVDGELNYIPR